MLTADDNHRFIISAEGFSSSHPLFTEHSYAAGSLQLG